MSGDRSVRHTAKDFHQSRWKFLDFDSVGRCLVLDLDMIYELILGMAWLELHESWIDWRSTTLGATRTVPSGDGES